jgi:hypothetical protein
MVARRLSQLDLAQVGLPDNYAGLTSSEQRKVRLACLTGWFDPSRPHILCTDVEKYVKAHRLWVEYYMKSDRITSDKYFFNDPLHKYDMVRGAMAEPKNVGQAARALIIAPRGTNKTVTLIHELCTMVAICRPNTPILVSERNEKRTTEEMNRVRKIIETNERIHRDFGGEGRLWKAVRSGRKDIWKSNWLSFEHYNGSSIIGSSTGESTRGRHPLLVILDDPDDGESYGNPEVRADWYRWLLGTVLPQMFPGSKLIWMQTNTGRDCLIRPLLAGMEINGIVQEESLDDDGIARDERWGSWTKVHFSMIMDANTDHPWSIWEEYISVEGFEDVKKSLTVATAMAEYQGIAVSTGQILFKIDSIRHGYTRYTGEDGKDRFLDLKTGQDEDWQKWLDGLIIVAACDPAFKPLSHDSDSSAIVVVGIDSVGTTFILDAYNKKCHPDAMIAFMYEVMCLRWDISKVVWEAESAQLFVYRVAAAYAAKLQEAGRVMPASHPITTKAKTKTLRVMGSLTPLIGKQRIRFPILTPVMLNDGKKYTPTLHPSAQHLRALREQIELYTDAGSGSGHDDLIDALEMAIRVSHGYRGTQVQDEPEGIEAMIQDWEKVGVHIGRENLDHRQWTKEMWRDWKREHFGEPESDYVDPFIPSDEPDPYELGVYYG